MGMLASVAAVEVLQSIKEPPPTSHDLEALVLTCRNSQTCNERKKWGLGVSRCHRNK